MWISRVLRGGSGAAIVTVWCRVGGTGGQRLDGLGCQAGFGWVAEARETGKGSEPAHRLARDPSGKPSKPGNAQSGFRRHAATPLAQVVVSSNAATLARAPGVRRQKKRVCNGAAILQGRRAIIGSVGGGILRRGANGSLANTWSTAIEPLANPYRVPIRHLSDRL